MVQEIRDAVAAAKAEVKLEKRAIVREKIEAFQEALPTPALRALSSIQVKGASSWLSVVPLHEHGFSLAKGDFRDALALHFSWHSSLSQLTVCVAKSSPRPMRWCAHVAVLPSSATTRFGTY